MATETLAIFRLPIGDKRMGRIVSREVGDIVPMDEGLARRSVGRKVSTPIRLGQPGKRPEHRLRLELVGTAGYRELARADSNDDSLSRSRVVFEFDRAFRHFQPGGERVRKKLEA